MAEYYDDYLIPDEEDDEEIRSNMPLYIEFDPGTITFHRKYTEKELINGRVNGERLIDYLFENNLITLNHISSIESYTEIVDLCFRYNKIELLRGISEKIVNFDPSILDKLFDYDIIPFFLLGKEDFLDYQIKTIVKYHRYDLFTYANAETLLTNIGDKTLLELLLDLNQDVNVKDVVDVSIFQILIRYGRIDLISTNNISLLLKNANINETYLDLILEYSKKHEDYNIDAIISKVNAGCNDNLDDMVKAYVIFAKHGLAMYLNKITKEKLFKNVLGEQLIDKLVGVERKVLAQILRRDAYNDIDVVIYLYILPNNARVEADYNEDFILKTLFDILSIRESKISDSDEMTLQQLKVLLMEDMDEVDLERIISWFRFMISNNHSTIELVEQIIKAKQKEGPNDKKFKYTYSDELNGSSYNTGTNVVSLGLIEDNPLVICHETGHMLHKKLYSGKIPANYDLIRKKVKEDPLILRKVYFFSVEYKKLKEKVEAEVEEKYMVNYDAALTSDRKNEIREFLELKKQEKIDYWVKRGRAKEYIEIVTDDIYSADEYIKQERKMFKDRIVEIIFRLKYGYLTQISDTIDSLFDGLYMHGMLKYNNKTINCFSGHGAAYYHGNIFSMFRENIANYFAMRYSTDGFVKMDSFEATNPLDLYREIMGDEFVNMIEQTFLQMTDLSKEQDSSVIL